MMADGIQALEVQAGGPETRLVYDAFLSYTHRDRAVASGIQSHKQWRNWVSPDIPYTTVCPGLPIPPD
jgi:hypothetical protein